LQRLYFKRRREIVTCPKCGSLTGNADRFCSFCGASLMEAPETVLYSFGPWGTGICFKRPRFFTVIQKNDTIITATDRRVCGESSFKRGTLRFNVPYKEVHSMEVFGYTLWKVLWIRYQEANRLLEVSIMCPSTNAQHIHWLYEFLQKSTHLST
jgi:hypothetical protein